MAKKRSINLYLEDILESILKNEFYVEDVAEHEFESNHEKQDAVIRRLEIIGEAVKKIPDQVRKRYPKVPWRQLAGLRDVVIHEYFGVSASLIYRTVTLELVELKDSIKKMISDGIS